MGLNTAGIVPPLGGGGGGGGSQDLNQTLINGHDTGGEDIILSDKAASGGTQYSDSILSEDTTAGLFFEVLGTGSGVCLLAASNKSISITNSTKSLVLSSSQLFTDAFLWANSGGKVLGGLEVGSSLIISSGAIYQIDDILNQISGSLQLGASSAIAGELIFANTTDGSFISIKSTGTSKLKIDNAPRDVAIGINTDPVAGVDLSLAGILNLTANSKFKINNVQLFDEVAETTYSGTITWDGTAPTTLTNATYRWSRVGKVVTLRIHLRYTTGGTTNTNVTLTLPSGAPTPQDPSGFSSASDIGYIGAGSLGTGPGNASGGTTKAYLGPNATATGYLITINTATSIAAKVVRFEVDYFIA